MDGFDAMEGERMTDEGKADETRRDFFKSVGRGMVLGLVGGGTAFMLKTGRLDLTKCINEASPCNRCIALQSGCGLPKAVTFRKDKGHGRS
jgi:hypothetical protein